MKWLGFPFRLILMLIAGLFFLVGSNAIILVLLLFSPKDCVKFIETVRSVPEDMARWVVNP